MTESGLRMALLIIGLMIWAGIYFYSRWRSQKRVDDIFATSHGEHSDVLLEGNDASQLVEPVLQDTGKPENKVRIEPELKAGTETVQDESQTPVITAEPALEPVAEPVSEQEPIKTDSSETPADAEPNLHEAIPKRLKLVVMHLMAKQGKKLAGAAVLKALQAHKLRFGDMDIFHRIAEVDDKDMSIFSIANMVKPGTLIPDEMDKAEIPGVSFILRLPAPIDSLKAYDDMLHCVQHMATTLDADIKDEEFMTLSREKIALQRAQLF